MARLKSMPSRLVAATGGLKPVMGHGADRDKVRDKIEGWRVWYHSAEWKRLRWQVLVEAQFTCAMCRRIEGDTSKLVGDHIMSHHGDRVMFFDRANVQCLCKACHDGAKQRQDRRRGGGSKV